METARSLEENKREQIKEIERLPLDMAQRAELMLVLLGLKPATNVKIYGWSGSPLALKNTLEGMGFYVKAVRREQFSKKLIQEFAVSLDENIAGELSKLSPAKDHEEFGRLMGFPETAIRGYLENDILDPHDRPKEKDVIFSFTLSKDLLHNNLSAAIP